MWLLYNILLYVYFLTTLPFYIYKIFTSEKYRVGLKYRLGFIPDIPKRPCILIHAVSVGEFIAAVPLVKSLEKEYPECQIIVSTTTLSGNRIARKELPSHVSVLYFPLDFGWSVRMFLKKVSPKFVVLMETELWPNFLRNAKKNNIPVAIINGRISDKSYKNYYLFRRFFKQVSKSITLWGMQTERDKEKVIHLGADPKGVFVTGSIKFDSAINILPSEEELLKIKKDWGWQKDLKIIVGGSTHKGEEEILLDIYKDLKDNFNSLILVIAPRHPERAGEIKDLIEKYKLRYLVRSKWTNEDNLFGAQVVLVDTFGEMISLYSMASVVFIGKSMVKGGGQNLIEPAALGKAVVCGPLMWNFHDITKWMVKNDGILQVQNKERLKKTIKELLENQKQSDRMGSRAKELVMEASGAVDKNVRLIKSIV